MSKITLIVQGGTIVPVSLVLPTPVSGLDIAKPVTWTANDLGTDSQLELLDNTFDVKKETFDAPPKLYLLRVEKDWMISSGAISLNADKLDNFVKKLWHDDLSKTFGKPEHVLVTGTGLHLVTKKTDGKSRRFRLEKFHADSEPSLENDGRVVWRQVSWQEAGANLLDPIDRIQDLTKKIGDHVSTAGPISVVVGPPTSGGSILLHIRWSNNNVDARERVVFSSALSIGGAEWTPKGMTVEGNQFVFDDGDDPFADAPFTDPSTKALLTALTWDWNDDGSLIAGSPKLTQLGTDRTLFTTGAVPGAGANLPYVWQVAKLIVGDKQESDAWIRYCLPTLAEGTPSFQADIDARLSQPIRVTGLGVKTNNELDWQFDLSLRDGVAGPRIRLELNIKQAKLIIVAARIRGWSPQFSALRVPLADPAALPNQPDQFRHLKHSARFELSNDYEQGGGLAVRLNPDGSLRLEPAPGDVDAVVAYIVGPWAGLDTVSRSGGNGNIDPAHADNRSGAKAIRRYNAGRVPVSLTAGLDLSATGSVKVSDPKGIHIHNTQSIATLLPWSFWEVGFDPINPASSQLRPHHANLALEAYAWDATEPYRHSTADPGAQSLSADARYQEAVAVAARAVRDRFGRLTTKPLTTATTSPVANWLSSVNFLADDREKKLVPTIQFTPPQDDCAIPQLAFQWVDDALPKQTLALMKSGQTAMNQDLSQTGWLNAQLRWVTDDADSPTLRVAVNGSTGGKLADGGCVPVLAQRQPVTAVAAVELAGRTWVFAATEFGSRKLVVWEPANPKPTTELSDLADNLNQVIDTGSGNVPISQLSIDARKLKMRLAVVQDKVCTVITLVSAGTGIKLEESVKVTVLESIRVARLVSNRLFLGRNGSISMHDFSSQEKANNAVWTTNANVVALDARGLPNTITLIVAVAERDNVKLYVWDASQELDGDPTQGPTNPGEGKQTPVLLAPSGEELTSIFIQPIDDIQPTNVVQAEVIVYATTNKGRIITWKNFKIFSTGNIEALQQNSVGGGDVGFVGQEAHELLAEPMNGDDEAVSNFEYAPPAGLFLSRRFVDETGNAGIRVWQVNRWRAAENGKLPRPSLRAPVVLGGDAGPGPVRSVAIVPGRLSRFEDSVNSSYKWALGPPRIITGGADGTLRVWEPETGRELQRHVLDYGGSWLDSLGVVRTAVTYAQGNYLVEVLSVPHFDDKNKRDSVLLFSTRSAPVVLASGTSDILFSCRDIPLRKTDDNTYTPVPFEDNAISQAFRHGVCSLTAEKSVTPQLAGLPVRFAGLVSIKLNDPKQWPTQGVTAEQIIVSVILINPADTASANTQPVPVIGDQVTLKFSPNGNSFRMDVADSSRFDWHFPLTPQVPLGLDSALTGRLARLRGSVAMKDGRIELFDLEPTADVLGIAAKIQVPDQFRLIQDDTTRGFRESGSGLALEPVKATLKLRTALAAAEDMPGTIRGLVASTDKDPLAWVDLVTERSLVEFQDAIKRVRLLPTADSQQDGSVRAAVVHVDGTVRVRSLGSVKIEAVGGIAKFTEDGREQSRMALPSPAEDLEVFRTTGGREWFLARCRDGSAWAWRPTGPDRPIALSLPDAPVTAIAFGPRLPNGWQNKLEYRHWSGLRELIGVDLSVAAAAGTGMSVATDDIDAIAAVGGADGRVHLYVLREKGKPVLLRTLEATGNAVRSLSLGIDDESLEATQLVPNTGDRYPGIVVLACDGDRPRLIELFSRTELFAASGNAGPFAQNGKAELGIILTVKTNNGKNGIHVILQGNDNKLRAFVKSVSQLQPAGEFEVGPLQTIREGSDKKLIVVPVQTEWKRFEWTGTSYEGVDEQISEAKDADTITVLLSKSETPSKRVLLAATNPNGSLKICLEETEGAILTEQQSALLGSAAVPTDSTLTTVPIPMLVVPPREGVPGSIWAADLNAPERLWPEDMGPVVGAQFALAGHLGSPHLIVTGSTGLTVWNLDTGRAVVRVVLPGIACVEALSDGKSLYTMVGTGDKSNRKWTLFNGVDNEAELDPAESSARLIPLATGLKSVSLRRIKGTPPKLELRVRRPRETDQPKTLDDIAGDIEILDALNAVTDTWVLAKIGGTIAVISYTSGKALQIKVPTEPPLANPAFAAFDLNPNETDGTCSVVTLDITLTRVTLWNVKAAGLTQTESWNVERSELATNKLLDLRVVPYDRERRLLVSDGMKLLEIDLKQRKLVRTQVVSAVPRVSTNSNVTAAPPRLVLVPVRAVATIDKTTKRIRLWDLATGRLRGQYAVDSSPGMIASPAASVRPVLALTAENSVAVLDLIDGKLTSSPNIKVIGDLTAAWKPDRSDLLVAGIRATSNDANQKKTFLWTFTNSGRVVPTAQYQVEIEGDHLALAEVNDQTWLATAKNTTIELSDATDTTTVVRSITTTKPPTRLRLSKSFSFDSNSLAVAMVDDAAVTLFDVPLSGNRPFSKWVANHPGAKSLTLFAGIDGPCPVVDDTAYRPAAVLRLSDRLQVCALPVILFDAQGATVTACTGRLTPSRRLDLEIKFPQYTLNGFTARAALVQGPYTCFLIDRAERTDSRFSGAVVLNADVSGQPCGLALLDEVLLNATAKVNLGNGVIVNATGPLVRLQAIPLNTKPATTDVVAWREILTWHLFGKAGNVTVDLHLSEAVLNYKTNSLSAKTVVRGRLTSEKNEVQGDFAVTVTRDNQDTYTIEFDQAMYAARSQKPPASAEYGTTRDDLVYPAGLTGSVGQTFDIVEPTLETDAKLERLQLVAIQVKADGVELLPIADHAAVPIDLTAGPNALRPMPKLHPYVPSLIHREANGTRIRSQWPTGATVVPPPANLGSALTPLDNSRVWMVAPLAKTSSGISALMLNVFVRPEGRPLDWVRLRTESVLAIYGGGGILFDPESPATDAANPSIVTLLAGTVRRSSDAVRSQPQVLFDDETIRTQAINVGASGVLLVRNADTRGQITYRFVNSPYHTIPAYTPLRTVKPNNNSKAPQFDPRLVASTKEQPVSTVDGPRYRPMPPNSSYSREWLLERKGNATSGWFVQLTETPALQGAEAPMRSNGPPQFNGAVDNASGAFLPRALELAFGPDKPGAIIHQTVTCRSFIEPKGNAITTAFARRDPLRVHPPASGSLVFGNARNDHGKLTIPWTEVLGVVPVTHALYDGQIPVPTLAANKFTFKAADRIAMLVTRFGEQVRTIPGGGSAEIIVSLTSFATGRRADDFELLLITRAEFSTTVPLTTPGATPVTKNATPRVVILNNGVPAAVDTDQFSTQFELIPNGNSPVKVWKLLRNTAGKPILLNRLITLGGDSNRDLTLNIVWLPENETLTGAADVVMKAYGAAPKLFGEKGLVIRNVSFPPLAPRLAAVLRRANTGVNSNSDLITRAAPEVTLFDGPAASTGLVDVKVESSNNETSTVTLSASDIETLSQPTWVGSNAFVLFLVKLYEDGATLFISTQLNGSGS